MTRMLVVATVAATLRGFLLPFADHFRALGWTVDGMGHGAESCDGLRGRFDRLWDMNWSRNPLAARNLLSCRRKVRQIVERGQYGLVHVHTPVAAFVSRLALRGLRRQGRVKVVYTAHGFHFHRGNPRHRNFLFERMERTAGRWTDRLVVINGEDFASAERLRLVPKPHLMYMPGIGVDTSALTPDSVSQQEVAAIASELGLRADERYLLVVAELVANKRHADVLRALARLSDSGARPHLVLAGEGPLHQDLQRLAASLGLADRVHFLGFRRDVPALMRGSAAVVLASAREGLPRSVLEAMCLAVPVIGSDVRGTRDLLKEDAGLLTPPGDVDALAVACRRAVDRPDEMAQVGRRGHQRIKDYDLQKVIALHETLYADALQQPAPAVGPCGLQPCSWQHAGGRHP